ncbi:S8 family serine peptidase [Xanthomarina sp. F2636L]|uniref:S8 family serine peptidase n=1 Tax=Xanthomarina sp. F2636L TaxID=2996018 RepID=UPI00225E3ABB|nr:S8 family serine peptidase [Xanthomarina sp. F2636L]MCX7549324.1 S8 family serine peptidase [Xanthomarina sp. F2636L]
MTSRLLFLLLLCFQLQIFAQEDAWVYLTDKENVAASIADPISILTQKAIDRKAAHAVPIDARDVPVNETYISQIKTEPGIIVLAKSKWFNAIHVRGSETDINNLSGLAFVDNIVYADNNLNARTSEPENKFNLETLRATFNYGAATNQIEMIQGDLLHQENYTGTGLTIAVIDAGFPNVNTMGGFQRLRDNNGILGGYDFFDRNPDVYANTSSSHGTLVLSTMAGYIEDSYVGTAPDAFYYLFRTENAPNENPVEESLWVEAAERADSLGVDIINSSLGYKTYDNPNYTHSDADLDGLTTFISKGANMAFEKGILVVNSAGNSGANGLGAPADAAGVFTIGAVDSNGDYATFSSQGSAFQPTQKPDVVTQGQASAIIWSNNTVGAANGTSFSSPIMAGAIACLWQALPDLNNAEIMQLVRESASQYSSPDHLLGYGIPNLTMALNNGLSIDQVHNIQKNIQVYPNPVINELHLSLPVTEKQVQVVFYNMIGKKVLEANLDKSSIINVSSLAKGVYLLKMKTQNKTITKKIIKK